MKTVSAKSSTQLFIWGVLLLPSAYISDCVLDSVLFNEGPLWEQLTQPTYHEIAIRVLFGTFILSGIYLGMHFLARGARKEHLLLQQNQNLQLFKRELEEFNENMSQNLRNSSTELMTTVELLRTRCGNELDEKTNFLVQNVYIAGKELEDRTDIILSLAETATGEIHRERTELDRLAQKIKKEILTDPDQQLEISIKPHMTAWCDPKMMYMILHNLFMNAISFIPKGQQGRIEFGKLYRNGQAIYFVRDNGIGFNDGQATRIFDPFRDPEQDPKLPRDTIKLASARRMVMRHGGRIWAEGVPGAGGSIFFTDYSLEIEQH